MLVIIVGAACSTEVVKVAPPVESAPAEGEGVDEAPSASQPTATPKDPTTKRPPGSTPPPKLEPTPDVLDMTYGDNGSTTGDATTYWQGTIALDGSTFIFDVPSKFTLRVRKYTPSGAPDGSFGSGGVVQSGFLNVGRDAIPVGSPGTELEFAL